MIMEPSPILMYQKLAGYKYRVARDCYVDLPWLKGVSFDSEWINIEPTMGRLTGKAGYCYDGASGPTIDTDDSMRGTLWHDIGYQLIRLGVLPKKPYKKLFDKLLRDTCIDAGMPEIRADLWHEFVTGFGNIFGLGKDGRGKILIAP